MPPRYCYRYPSLGWRLAWAGVVGGLGSVVGVLSHAGVGVASPFSKSPPVALVQSLGAVMVGVLLGCLLLAASIALRVPAFKERLPGVLLWVSVLGFSGIPALFAVSAGAQLVERVPIEYLVGGTHSIGGLLAFISWIRVLSLARLKPSA